MRRDRIDVGGDNIGFDFVDRDLFRRARMVYRVDHRQQFPRAAAVAQCGKGHRGPDRRMGILPAVFPHPGNVALDVAGIQVRFVERRVQKLDQAVLPANKELVHRFHCRARAFGIPGAGQNRPALRDRVDLAFGIARRAERRAVVEVSAPVPFAVPAVLFDIAAQAERLPPGSVLRRTDRHAAARLAESHEHFIQEESQPDAFALAVLAHQVHAVVPVAGADERQAVLAEAEAPQNGPHAVFVQAGCFVGRVREDRNTSPRPGLPGGLR